MSDANHTPADGSGPEHKTSNFLRAIIERDLEQGSYASRRWAGTPGDGAHHGQGEPDPAKIRTRFPPEPNGYLHVGHAKSICLNFGLARDYGGVCHMRFDDTNPEKEEKEYVDSILDAVQWLGFGWDSSFGGKTESHLYYASDYFDFMYRAAEALIQAGHAYVDEQTPEAMRASRGDFTTPGTDSPFRARSPEENLARFREMRDGRHADGAMVLRAKIDMASPNINLRDPAIYRIRRATHHNTGDRWCIYPMYTFAHPIEDALENITHSICTLEFEDQRPFYDWLLDKLAELGLLARPLPRQYEFARLNLTYVITSKRKLAQLVNEGHVSGWDDPRMPTIVGLRRRGYTPESLQLFAERIGVTKADSWIDYSTLEIALRDDLENKAHRGMAVLDPVRLVLTNWDEVMGAGHLEPCSLPALPHVAEGRTPPPAREFTIGREVWIEREDFAEVPPKGYKRLFPGNKVRLKGGFVVECTGCEKDADGRVTTVLATVVPDTKSGTPGADAVKVKAAITWVGVADGVAAEVRLYDRLFTDAHPDAGGKDFKASLNPDSCRVITAYVEPSLAQAVPDEKFQFERHGYFVADRQDHAPGRPVFNRITGLKDSWGK
ncbi:glutaminyl-tRNA synthetase [Sphaerotilus sulfidivorans]|uniref:Glutamine--tRNA ligase n=1 Tax=Sphaerotilus sulfidivorans TaxID=639200 RepID=A0A5C1Q219_9BURK|nr:glutamine--tRNA ligase/YqeY domain fusion protein [Sphaerotilus sulfidivorans]NZD45766.1 glutamine--tRNA ligase/YqeY domain fusion protein [Sphaerotilus sulfidivorans]QEN01090.1 glutamine--tRNA ligase/YqeY domain fusion protein [Sphaerotilus sulfidivorans]